MRVRTPAGAAPVRRRRTAAVIAALLGLAGVAGCASVPSSGPVMYRVANADDDDAVGLVPPGPVDDADPESLVSAFLLASGSGAAAPNQFETAKLYLTGDAAGQWAPTGDVVVYEGSPTVTQSVEGPGRVRVSILVDAVARVDAHGAYAEASQASPYTTSFELVQGDDEQWRIDELDDGVIVREGQFADQFRATPLYFPSADQRSWVPDQRWFPRSSWRTNAVDEVLDGPSEWLLGAVGEGPAPEGTELAVPTVTADGDGAYQVSLGPEIAGLTEARLALLYAQLAATLSDGGVEPEIALYSEDGLLTEPPQSQQPSLPATLGSPVALAEDGELYSVSDGELTDFQRTVHLQDLTPTAIALGPGASPVVVLDGDERIVRVADVPSESGQQELLRGDELVAPSVDPHGFVWSSADPGRDIAADEAGELLVAHESGTTLELGAPWLEGRGVVGVRVAPDGTRVAIVTEAAGGTRVHVAAVVRDENHVPQELTKGIEVAASVSGVVVAQWSGQTSLLLLAEDGDGTTSMHQTGVGGLPDDSGSTAAVQELYDVDAVTAGVADSGALALTSAGELYEEHPTGWGEPIAEKIDAIGYPG
ncbi:LpqB family beta-propeller domain-containing protein [Myceligenerans crystallogenes]|uniref:LpqB family beta-propeller domain-containing protein n=1 Tax=Myceligenerans crystallogenes TaxID=316335 RepID=A0ABP4ZPP9_9MICO